LRLHADLDRICRQLIPPSDCFHRKWTRDGHNDRWGKRISRHPVRGSAVGALRWMPPTRYGFFPGFVTNRRADLFGLCPSRVYREIAPLLAAEDPGFRHEYDEMREQVRVSQGAHGARIHRKWMPCDTKVVEAWLAGRYPYRGETWDQFRERVAACRLKMLDARQENILVVTSGTPLAIWTGLSLESSDERIIRLAAA
jgi:Histidine phosphatase superfamily (branch 1)